MKHPNVEACCVVGKNDIEKGMGQLPYVFIVLKKPDDITVDEIRDICKENLTAKFMPCDFEIIEKLPLTDNGKVAYRELEKRINV